MFDAYLLYKFLSGVVELVHIPVYLEMAYVFVEVRLQVGRSSKLALRLATSGYYKMPENVISHLVKAYAVIDTSKYSLRSVQ